MLYSLSFNLESLSAFSMFSSVESLANQPLELAVIKSTRQSGISVDVVCICGGNFDRESSKFDVLSLATGVTFKRSFLMHWITSRGRGGGRGRVRESGDILFAFARITNRLWVCNITVNSNIKNVFAFHRRHFLFFRI